jgi:hypothetical protein
VTTNGPLVRSRATLTSEGEMAMAS